MVSINSIREHYDTLSPYYNALWGQHIHHGYFDGCETQSQAQIRLIEELARQAGIQHSSKVLDIGCGLGGSSLWLAKNLDCSVTGITISPVQAKMAAKRADADRLSDRVSFTVMDANSLQFDPELFDVVWIIECSEHLTDKQKFFRECASVLKPGGKLALCSWLQGENLTENKQALVEAVCHGMLLPGMATMSETVQWIAAAGLGSINARDITMNVQQTWVRCIEIASRPEIQAALAFTNDSTKDFVRSFTAMHQAYKGGAMSYTMVSAVR